MKTLITWILIFVFGFIVGAGVGFKVLEGVSGDLLVEAWDNSYKQFQQSYPGSTAQQQLGQKVEEQKQVLTNMIKEGLKKQILNMFSFDNKSDTENK